MPQPIPGERLSLANAQTCSIRIDGRHPERIAAVAVQASGAIVPFEQRGPNEWSLDSLSRFTETTEILLYIVDDRLGGFVNDSYPITVGLDGVEHGFPPPSEQLAAVIIGEIYSKAGALRLKVANEGYIFGIDAYARARNMGSPSFPKRSAPRPSDGTPRDLHRDRPTPSAGTPLGSGSGILIAPGIIVTNAHVIEDGSSFQVGRGHTPLTPIAVDPMHDLALLRGEVEGVPLPLRFSSPIWLGEAIMAAGFPLKDLLGADLKVSTGNVSGMTGSHGDVARFQFTAPIGSGSSGGAVIDEFGNLIGVTSASLAHDNIRDRGSISENVNFGIKASLVYEMLAAAGIDLPTTSIATENARREVVQRLRRGVISINVLA
ncbi:MAG: serine protease [Sphingomonas sp.]